MTLAGGLRADHEVDTAVSQDSEIRALARNAAGPLDIVCDRDAGELAARFGSFAPCRKAGPVGEFKRAVHHLLVFATVISHADQVAPRQRLGGNDIAPAQFHAIEPALRGGEVHEPLDTYIASGRPALR